MMEATDCQGFSPPQYHCHWTSEHFAHHTVSYTRRKSKEHATELHKVVQQQILDGGIFL